MAFTQFYFTPGACSIGIHILLEEVEEMFQANRVDLLAGEHRSDIPIPERLLEHYQSLLQRPSVRQVLMEEGYHSTLTR